MKPGRIDRGRLLLAALVLLYLVGSPCKPDEQTGVTLEPGIGREAFLPVLTVRLQCQADWVDDPPGPTLKSPSDAPFGLVSLMTEARIGLAPHFARQRSIRCLVVDD